MTLHSFNLLRERDGLTSLNLGGIAKARSHNSEEQRSYSMVSYLCGQKLKRNACCLYTLT